MKKLALSVLTVIMLATFNPMQSLAIKEKVTETLPASAPVANAQVTIMLNRLQEIKDMDKTELSRLEKKELRNEVKEIKAQLRATNNGVFLSVGAIIIIILLLILLV